MSPRYGGKSSTELLGVDPRLFRVFYKVIEFLDVSVLNGRRTFGDQLENIASGASRTIDSDHIPRDADGVELLAGLSRAVDSAPYPIRWPHAPEFPGGPYVDTEELREYRRDLRAFVKDTGRFYYMAGAIAAVAHADGVPIRQGVDWDRDGDFSDQEFDDLGHVELALERPELRLTDEQKREVAAAFEEAARRRG